MWAWLFLTLLTLAVFASIVGAEVVAMQKTGEIGTNGHLYVTSKQLGNNGRLGNQLFQVASTIAMGTHLRREPVFSEWSYRDLFEDNPCFKSNTRALTHSTRRTRSESHAYAFDDMFLKQRKKNLNVTGYRIHPRYFQAASFDVRRALTLSKGMVAQVLSALPAIRSCIGVHVRRGDYVGDSRYDICSTHYYQQGIKHFKKLAPEAPVIIVSDDKEWCRTAFPGYPISPFDSDKLDFICLSLCQYKVISNSTFAWWCAWLDVRFDSRVFAPSPWVNQSQWQQGSDGLYLKDWTVFDTKSNRVRMSPQSDEPVELGAYYQCFKQREAFIGACQAYRRVYPKASLVIVSDDGDDFTSLARDFGAVYWRNDKRSGNGTTTEMSVRPTAELFVRNFLKGAHLIEQKWFILLEDDVYVESCVHMGEVRADIVGNNTSNNGRTVFNDRTQAYLRERGVTAKYYGGCGGSLFKTEFWRDLSLEGVMENVKVFGELNDVYHSDMLLSFICVANGGKIINGQERFPSEFSEKRTEFGERPPAILHQFKQWYK